MKVSLNWTDGMKFEAQADTNHTMMDAKSPIGKGQAMTPKELVAAGLGGCTAMDVVAYLRKHKQGHKKLSVDVEIETTSGVTPMVFTKALITFTASGEIDPQVLTEAVHLSQTKYCGVSAMMLKAFPISYRVILNDQFIAEGQSHFN